MKWTDSREIALALAEKHPNIDPNLIRSSQLRIWVMELNKFNDEPDLCNDKILETIQANWIEESADTAEDS